MNELDTKKKIGKEEEREENIWRQDWRGRKKTGKNSECNVRGSLRKSQT